MDEWPDLVDVPAPYWSAARTALMLGIDENGLAERCATGALLGVPATDGTLFYPVVQFLRHADGSVAVRAELADFFRVLRARQAWTVAIVMMTPAAALDGLSPIEWIRARRDPAVLAKHAERVDAQFRRP